MVATNMAKAAFEDLKSQGLDLASLALPVEQVCQGLLHLVCKVLHRSHSC
jgi:hypothetical protein